MTTAPRLLGVVRARARLRRHAVLEAVLVDVAAGTSSVLEHGYTDGVERAHGLPTSRLQVRVVAGDGRVTYRDAEYEDHGVVVELDGRLFHDSSRARDRDMERDLDTALEDRVSVRLGYGQVMGRRCLTARQMGELLQRRGWAGPVRRCPDCP